MVIFSLLAIAGISNAVMDISSEGSFIFKWWNKNESWKNKHNFNVLGKTLPDKYHNKFVKFLLNGPLVLLTDGWHLVQFVFHTAWQLTVTILLVRDKGDFLQMGDNILTIIVSLIIVKFTFSTFFAGAYDTMKTKD